MCSSDLGPRHLVFRPDGKFAYVVNELDSTVTAFAYDAARGRLTEIQSISTLPAGFTGRSTTAEIQIHPNGQLLFASNRGHDSIAAFSVDGSTGALEPISHTPTEATPRAFALDPDGTINPENQRSLPGSEALDSADGIVMALRFRRWPDDAMRRFAKAVARGVPITALRTSTHAFLFPNGHPTSFRPFNNFGREVLGENWVSHWEIGRAHV